MKTKRIFIKSKYKKDIKYFSEYIKNKYKLTIDISEKSWESIKDNSTFKVKAIDDNENSYILKVVSIKKLILLILLPILFILVGIISWNYLTPNKDIIPPEINSDIKKAGKLSDQDLKTRMQKEVDKGYVNLQINTNIIFENSESFGTIKIVNPEKNDFNMNVQYFVNDTMIYESGILESGSYINKAKMENPLPKGSYTGVAKVFIYDKSGNLENNPSVDFNLEVKN